MKRALFTLFAAAILTGLAGCLHDQVAVNGAGEQPAAGPGGNVVPCGWLGRVAFDRGACPRCGGVHGIACGGRRQHGTGEPSGPPVGQITYPYYTLRGPRDFLQRSPSPIGP